jgi:hypothetical protein
MRRKDTLPVASNQPNLISPLLRGQLNMLAAHGAKVFDHRGSVVPENRDKKEGRTPLLARPEIYKAPNLSERNLYRDCTAD